VVALGNGTSPVCPGDPSTAGSTPARSRDSHRRGDREPHEVSSLTT
jgi:hypothetical protein